MRIRKLLILLLIAVFALNMSFVYAATDDSTGKPVEVNSQNPERIIDFEIDTPKGTVIINYLDDNSKALAAQEKYTVEVGKHTYTAKSFNGYNLTSEKSQTVEIKTDGETQTINFNYAKIIVPVIVPTVTPEPQKPTPTPTPKPVEKVITGSVKGYLLTDKNEPIANAVIELHSNPMTTRTDAKGYFEFNNVELGNHTIYLVNDEYSKSLVQLKQITVKEDNEVKGTLPGDEVLTALKDKGNIEAAQVSLTPAAKDKEVQLIVSLKVKGKIIVKYLLNGKEFDQDVMNDLDMGKHLVKAKDFKEYALVSKPAEKEVELTEETPERTVVVEFNYAAVPPPPKKLPVWPIPVAAALLIAFLLYMRKNLKIFIHDEVLAMRKKEKLVAKKRVTAKKELKIALDNYITMADTDDLKLVFNRAISKRLAAKTIIFTQESKTVATYQVPETVEKEIVILVKQLRQYRTAAAEAAPTKE